MASWFGKPEPQQLVSEPVEQELIVHEEQAVTEEENSEESASLVLLSQAHRAIAEARSLNELKDIRDKAEAARKYAQAAGMGLEIQNYAAEVKLRAERRAGRLLAKLKLHGGDRSDATSEHRLTLGDIGVTKDQSSRWQLTAVVPEKEFENYVDTTRNESGEVTTAGLVRIARELKAKQRKQHKGAEPEEEVPDCKLITNVDELSSCGKFGCVYLDPPWPGGNENGQLLSTFAEIAVELVVEDCAHIHMWARDDSLFEAKHAIENWGFEFKGCLVCLNPEGTPDKYWMQAHEYLLLGIRGELPLMERQLNSWMRAPREANGAASERIRKIIERVSPGPYLELFGKKQVSGWTIHSTCIKEQEHGGSHE